MTSPLEYDVFLNDGPTQRTGVLPNGAPKTFSPLASTLIYGREYAVLTDPGFTTTQAKALGDWVVGKGVQVTDIFITHGHGDHWFAAGLLAERFGARVVAAAGAIEKMHGGLGSRPLIWDKLYDDIPPSPVTAVSVPDNRLTLEGHELSIVEVGHGDSDDSTVLYVPDLALAVAGDVIYNGAHQYLGDAFNGLDPWRAAIDKVEALKPQRIVSGHQNQLDDNAGRAIAGTRRYLDEAEKTLQTETTAHGFFTTMIEHHPDYAGQLILWIGAQVQYGVREHPEDDARQIVLSAWQ
jgi:glyoxylase-like metal-dependent hydrolase (beta-lactamase superfamily II)